MFKTECIEDMPYEQFRVMVASINQANAEAKKTEETQQETNASGGKKKKEKISFRIVNE